MNKHHGSHSTLEEFARELNTHSHRARSTLRVFLSDSDKAFVIDVVGVIHEKHQLLVTAPVTTGGGLVAVHKGQLFTCYWVSPAYSFCFTATILKITFEPIPLLQLQLTEEITCKKVRTLPRALVNLPAAIREPVLTTALIVDLSVGGSRIAVDHNTTFSIGQKIELIAKPHILGREYVLTLNCTVTGPTTSTQNEQGIYYYGLMFENISDSDLLILHGYVQECLTLEMDELSGVLLAQAKTTHSTENPEP